MSGFEFRMVQGRLTNSIDLDDRIWYVVLPAVGYVFETASGVVLALRVDLGCETLALSMGMLLVAGIHNVWDITVWSMTRPRGCGVGAICVQLPHGWAVRSHISPS